MSIEIQEILIYLHKEPIITTMLSGLIGSLLGGTLSLTGSILGIYKTSENDIKNRRYDAILQEFFKDALDIVKNIKTGTLPNNSYSQIINYYCRNLKNKKISKKQIKEDIKIIKSFNDKIDKFLNYGKFENLLIDIYNANHILLCFIEFIGVNNGIKLMKYDCIVDNNGNVTYKNPNDYKIVKKYIKNQMKLILSTYAILKLRLINIY